MKIDELEFRISQLEAQVARLLNATILKVYTVDEVAKVLQVSARTVNKHIKSGELKAFKVDGQSWRIAKQTLEDFIARQEVGQDNELNRNHKPN